MTLESAISVEETGFSVVAVGWGVFLSLGLAWRSVARGGTVRRAMALAALALLAVMVLARLLWYPQ